jgi:integrase
MKFGSVRKLNSGRYQVRYIDKNGIRRTARTKDDRPLTFTTQREAKTYLLHLESDMRRGYTDGDQSKGSELLRDRIEIYLSGARLTPGELRESTKKLYRGLADDLLLKPIDGFCIGDLPIKAITKADVRRWHFACQKLKRTGSRELRIRVEDARLWAQKSGIEVKSTGKLPQRVMTAWREAGAPILKPHSKIPSGETKVAQAYRLLRAVLNVAVDEELIPANPCRIRGADKAKSRERQVASIEDLGELAAAVPDRYRAAVLMAAFTSLRSGELFGLQRKHINLLRQEIKIEQQLIGEANGLPTFGLPKTESSIRTVSLPSELLSVIDEHLNHFTKANPDSLIFSTRNGTPITNARKTWWHTARRKVGFPGLAWHDLRHTGQTCIANRGATVRDIQRRAGQSTERAALLYLHGSADRDRKIAESLNEDVARSISISLRICKGA